VEADVQKRVALVTGGSRGIGRAIAERLAQRGVKLAILARRPEEAVEEMRAAGFEAQGVPLDLSAEDPRPAVERVLEHYGRLDILVYSAGMNVRKPVLELALEEWRAVQRVNIEAAFLSAQACAPAMLEKGFGRMLFVASLTSLHSGYKIPLTAYAASKSALLGLVRGLAKEWSSGGIRVNALCPGFIKTEFTVSVHGNPALYREITERIPVGRWGTPEDMAEAGAFLCSDGAEYITGQFLVADGGFLIY
jgi:2-deoxy-D-gluconate 3-dehydrogenase